MWERFLPAGNQGGAVARRRDRDTATLDLFAPRPPKPDSEGGLRPSPAWQPPPFHVLDPTGIEIRPYARHAFDAWDAGGNFGLVADTATGKTYLAYALADAVLASGKRVLFCAPTGILCEQHAALARTVFRIAADDVQLVTANRTPKHRTGQWAMGRLFVATPHLAANDLGRAILDLSGFGLVIIDEGHHAARTHAAITVANAAHARGVRILALTASPGGDLERIERIRENLHLDRWVRISEEATQAFRPPIEERREIIPIADVAQPIITQLEDVLERLTGMLVQQGDLETPSRAPSPAALKAAHDRIRDREALALIPIAAAAQQLTAVLSFVVSDDYGTALESLRRALEKRDRNGGLTRTARRLAVTPEVRRVRDALEALVRDGVRHPKQDALVRAIRSTATESSRPARTLVFNRYAAGVHRLVDILRTELGVRVEPAIGRSQMRSETLLDTLHTFGRGEVAIIVGTDVIREGIHIPELDFLVVYSPPRNERELIQLSGRVGRTRPGRIVTLVADHSIDKRYAFSAVGKAQRMRGALPPNTRAGGSDAGATHRSVFTGHPRKPTEMFVRNLRERFVFDRFRIVTASVERGRNGHGRPFVRMLVGDRTGTITLLHWCTKGQRQADEIVQNFTPGTIAIVAGTYEDGRTPRIIVNPRERQHITRCPEGDYDPADYERTPRI